MDTTLELKFTQHEDLKEELLATGDAELVEVCATCLHPMYIANVTLREGF